LLIEFALNLYVSGGTMQKLVSEALLTLLFSICKDTYDEIKIVFNQFVSQNTFQISEITVPSGAALIANKKIIDFDFDENYKDVLSSFHEYHVANALNYTFNQNAASETLSRRNAMDSASKNCKELKKKINIEFNKLRQAIITTELIEVTTGAVAAEEMQ